MRSDQTAVERFPKLRQSLLSAFDTCALSSKFDLDYAADWSGHPQGRGQIFHRFAAKALEQMAQMNDTTIPVDLSLAILHECLRQDDVDDEDFINIPMKEVESLYWTVKKWANDNAFDIEHLVDVEQRLNSTVSYEGKDKSQVERVLSGQLDALFIQGDEAEEAIVLDWKDTWALPAQTEVSFDGYFQQRFYGWLVMKRYPSVQTVVLREFYVRFSEPREAEVYRHNMEDIEDELAALAQRFDRAYDTDEWPPSPGKHCSWCLKPESCPIPKFARGEGRIEDAKEAEKVAARLVVAKAAYDQSLKALKAYADQHGPVPVRASKGKRVWGYRKSSSVSRPKKEDIEAALALGNVDLRTLYKEKTSTRFEQFTPKPEEEVDGDFLAKVEESLKKHKDG